MARLLLSFLTFVSLFTAHSLAVSWYTLTYWAPKGGQFTGFSGDMHVPALPQAGVYYLWPGLQPTDNSGVYQEVFDGRSGTWRIAPGWCCSNPSAFHFLWNDLDGFDKDVLMKGFGRPSLGQWLQHL